MPTSDSEVLTDCLVCHRTVCMTVTLLCQFLACRSKLWQHNAVDMCVCARYQPLTHLTACHCLLICKIFTIAHKPHCASSYVRSTVLTADASQMIVLWALTLCSVKSLRRFGGTLSHHLRGD